MANNEFKQRRQHEFQLFARTNEKKRRKDFPQNEQAQLPRGKYPKTYSLLTKRRTAKRPSIIAPKRPTYRTSCSKRPSFVESNMPKRPAAGNQPKVEAAARAAYDAILSFRKNKARADASKVRQLITGKAPMPQYDILFPAVRTHLQQRELDRNVER